MASLWPSRAFVCSTTNLVVMPSDALTQAMQDGIVFKGAKLHAPAKDKVSTKAKKKAYVTGSHGSGAAKKKADIRTRRANRHKSK